MPITVAVATLLSKAFKGLGKKEVAENINKGFTSIASVSGQLGLDKIKDLMNVADAKAPVLAQLNAQIQSETTEARMTLMKELLEMLENENIQYAISELIKFINLLLEGAAKVVDLMERMADAIGRLQTVLGEDLGADTGVETGVTNWEAFWAGWTDIFH